MKYIVTETAPPHVASRRVKAGVTIELTERAARYELQAGHIKPYSEEAANTVQVGEASPAKAKKG